MSTGEFTCGGNRNYDCIDSSSSCVGGYVLAGTKTTIGVSANAFDTRPGGASGDSCGGDGCSPDRSIDGIIHDIASRWSCEHDFVSDGQPCQIEFVFDDPQDIMEVQVAFWKGEERSRTLEVSRTRNVFLAVGELYIARQTQRKIFLTCPASYNRHTVCDCSSTRANTVLEYKRAMTDTYFVRLLWDVEPRTYKLFMR